MTTLGREALSEIDLLITHGADNAFAFAYSLDDGTATTPVDLTGWATRMQIRRKVSGAIWHELTDADGITLGVDGSITVSIDHAITEDPAWDAYSKLVDGEPQALGVYDLELIAPPRAPSPSPIRTADPASSSSSSSSPPSQSPSTSVAMTGLTGAFRSRRGCGRGRRRG